MSISLKLNGVKEYVGSEELAKIGPMIDLCNDL